MTQEKDTQKTEKQLKTAVYLRKAIDNFQNKNKEIIKERNKIYAQRYKEKLASNEENLKNKNEYMKEYMKEYRKRKKEEKLKKE
jgi:hypothetical protein